MERENIMTTLKNQNIASIGSIDTVKDSMSLMIGNIRFMSSAGLTIDTVAADRQDTKEIPEDIPTMKTMTIIEDPQRSSIGGITRMSHIVALSLISSRSPMTMKTACMSIADKSQTSALDVIADEI